MLQLYAVSRWVIFILCLSLASSRGFAFTTVTLSSGAPSGTENAFLSSTTNQFSSKLFSNPFFPNTYQLLIYGPNPSYNPPPSTQQILTTAAAISTTTFIYGFSDGMDYQNNVSISHASTMSGLCGFATNFALMDSSTMTFDRWTCTDVLRNLINEFFQLDLSTPTPIPPNGN